MKKNLFPHLWQNLKWIFLLLFIPSCGYRAVSIEERPSVSIPYIRGDDKGLLTSAVIAEMSHMGLYRYVQDGADFVLQVALIGNHEEVIGYRYDRSENSGKLQPNLLATENRRSMVAEVMLFREKEDEPCLGPFVVSSSAEFDYIDTSTLRELAFISPKGKREAVIDFSEGQLDSVEGAQDNALVPLYRNLAKKIAVAIQRQSF